jgi:hypothetical protein
MPAASLFTLETIIIKEYCEVDSCSEYICSTRARDFV